MSHLHCRHSTLPKGICIDVSIANHERRSLQCKTDLLSDNETVIFDEVLPTTDQQNSSGRMQHVENVIRNENFTDKNKEGVVESENVNINSDKCGIATDADIEPDQSDNSSAFQSDDNAKSSADFFLSTSSKRKSRKPSHVVVTDARCPQVTCTTDPDWVEIVAATYPMTARCPHCTFTCNCLLYTSPSPRDS